MKLKETINNNLFIMKIKKRNGKNDGDKVE